MKKCQRKKYMPFKLFEFLERFHSNLRKLDQQIKFLFSWKFKNFIPFETRNR